VSLGDAEFEYLRAMVHERSGIVIEPGRRYMVESRLSILARDLGLRSPADLMVSLHAEGRYSRLEQRIVEALTTNETYFFRDGHPFEALRKNILPALIQQRVTTKSLVIWCASCSSGQEPYSIALLLAEHFPELRDWSVRVLASDISTEMLDRARSGMYREFEMNRGLPANYRVKYFEKSGPTWILRPQIQRMVEFRTINLAAAWPPLPLVDVLLLRNVLIYFDARTKRDILENCARQLRPDGVLLVGASETTMESGGLFTMEQHGPTLCYRPTGRTVSRGEVISLTRTQ
jgi:chemotaxis protein methyltransferase CheR